MTNRKIHPLEEVLKKKIAIIDGAMGTTIRTYGMTEKDIRSERFKDADKDLLNNGDLFSLTQAKMIGDIHRRFLEAGADIIETNTFGATSIAQSEFFVGRPEGAWRTEKTPSFTRGLWTTRCWAIWRGRLTNNPPGVPGVGGPRGQCKRSAAVCGRSRLGR